MSGKIIQSKVDTFFLEEICPICEKGKIVKSSTSKVYLTDPPQLDVICNNNNCDYKDTRIEKELYPQVRYEYQPKEIETSKFVETKLDDNQLAFINQFLRNQLYIEINLKNNTSSQFKDDLDTLDIILQQLYNIDDYEKLSEKDWNSYSATIFHIYHNEEDYIMIPKKEIDEINDIYCADLNLVGIWFMNNIYELKIEYYTNYLDFNFPENRINKTFLATNEKLLNLSIFNNSELISLMIHEKNKEKNKTKENMLINNNPIKIKNCQQVIHILNDNGFNQLVPETQGISSSYEFIEINLTHGTWEFSNYPNGKEQDIEFLQWYFKEKQRIIEEYTNPDLKSDPNDIINELEEDIDDTKDFQKPKSIIRKSSADTIPVLYNCKMKHKTTKSNESFYVVADNITEAEEKAKRFIKESDYTNYDIITYDILGESYIYTGIQKLII